MPGPVGCAGCRVWIWFGDKFTESGLHAVIVICHKFNINLFSQGECLDLHHRKHREREGVKEEPVGIHKFWNLSPGWKCIGNSSSVSFWESFVVWNGYVRKENQRSSLMKTPYELGCPEVGDNNPPAPPPSRSLHYELPLLCAPHPNPTATHFVAFRMAEAWGRSWWNWKHSVT